MIIECGHCGAPLDVKGKERSSKCNYCGTANQVRAQRTIAFETPAGWQPPTQWQPPQHFAASSAQTLNYRKSSSMAGVIVLVAVVGVLALAGGIAASVLSAVTTTTREVSRANAEVDRATKQAGDAIAEALAQASAAQAEAERLQGSVPQAAQDHPQLSPLTNAGVSQVLAVFKEASGSSSLAMKRLTLHDAHSSAELQNASNPEHVDRYDYVAGRVRGPEPVRLIGREKSNLKSLLFDPEHTALAQLESLKTTALGKLAYEQTKVTHVIAERDRGKIVIRVYGSSPRDSGYVAFDEKGKVTRVAR